MEFKGTKGKWKVWKKEELPIVGSSDGTSLFIVSQSSETSPYHYDANALLISKSPILLQAIYDSIQELKEAGLTAMAEYHEKLYFECVNL